jgi:hypothetical protein
MSWSLHRAICGTEDYWDLGSYEDSEDSDDQCREGGSDDSEFDSADFFEGYGKDDCTNDKYEYTSIAQISRLHSPETRISKNSTRPHQKLDWRGGWDKLRWKVAAGYKDKYYVGLSCGGILHGSFSDFFAEVNGMQEFGLNRVESEEC